MDKDTIYTAWVSLVILAMLITITVSRLVSWRHLKTNGSDGSDLKKAFHYVLLATCTLELPLWFLILVPHVKEDTYSHYPKHPLFPIAYACHLLALPGYFVCVGIIVVLWSDLLKSTTTQFKVKNLSVNQERRHYLFKLITCENSVRSFFAFFVMVYMAMETAVAISIVAKTDIYHQKESFRKNLVYQASIIFDPVILVVFLIGFFFFGMKLQCHVIKVKLAQSIHARVVCQLNFFITVITVCFMLRAVVILALFFSRDHSKASDEYNSWTNNLSFLMFTLLTQWLPFFLTSFCLLYLMRKPPKAQEERPCSGMDEAVLRVTDDNDMEYDDDCSSTASSASDVHSLYSDVASMSSAQPQHLPRHSLDEPFLDAGQHDLYHSGQHDFNGSNDTFTGSERSESAPRLMRSTEGIYSRMRGSMGGSIEGDRRDYRGDDSINDSGHSPSSSTERSSSPSVNAA
jgi:hypothetical protein